MFYRKEGFPEENEIVLCTVTKVYPGNIFVSLDEYDLQGVINIAEIAPGRIRNIRDFVQEGKKVVCKVLRVDEEKKHIDLSLRRVTEKEKREKLNLIKKEQTAEKIIEVISKEFKKNPEDVYNAISNEAFKKYEYIHQFFAEIAEGKEKLEKIKLDKKILSRLKEEIEDRFKPELAIIGGTLKIRSYLPEGVKLIKDCLLKEINENVNITYLGGGKYKIIVKEENYKKAEKLLDKVALEIQECLKGNENFVEFRKDGKIHS